MGGGGREEGRGRLRRPRPGHLTAHHMSSYPVAQCNVVFHSVAECVTIVGAKIQSKGAADCVYIEKGRNNLRSDEKYANRSFG